MTGTPQHPSLLIDPCSVEIIRRFAPEAEAAGQLHEAQLAQIYQHQWLLLFVPKEYGGLELPLPQGIALQEALAWTDGSTAWVVTLCSGANWFSGFLQPSLAREIFANPKACLAGSGQPGGVARRTDKGFTISGHWKYATGAPHATAFTANCLVEAGNTGADKEPAVAAFVFWRNEVAIRKNWKVMGMQATGSESFEVKDLAVGKERCFVIDPAHAVFDLPLYRYPFLQLAEATLAANISGMAMRFLELAQQLMDEKTKASNEPALYTKAEQHMAALNRLRQAFYEALQRSWQESEAPTEDPSFLYEEVSRTSRQLAHGALQLADTLYPFCGLAAADPSTEINRVWRNLHTASQHVLLRPH